MFDKWDEPGTFEQRLQVIEDLHSSWVRDGGSDTLRLAETTLLWNMDDIWEFHDNAISMGQEGIILRDPKSYYKFGRGSPVQCELIKMKEGGWVDTEVLITGFNEENENTNEQTRDNLGNAQRSGHKENLIGKGTLGSFDVNGYLVEDGRSFECRVGSGLDASQRAEIWANKADYLGRFIKIKYFNRGIKDKPRFPIFLGFRSTDDMEPEAVKQLDLFK
jgi:DNA ligase-1